MCRFLHLNKLYPIEYSKIALQISNNIYQNQYLLYKENKIQTLYNKENPDETARSEKDPDQSNENETSRKQGGSGVMMQQIRDSAFLLVFDGAKNIEVAPHQCVLKPIMHDTLYYQISPATDRNHNLLQQLQYCKFHVRDLPKKIQESDKVAQVNQNDLINFPKFTKNVQKIVVEFQDCMIQAIDLLDF